MAQRLRKRKCRNCGDFFIPDPRNVKRQEYCRKPKCRKASKAAAQARWLAKDQLIMRRFLTLSSRASEYHQALEAKRMNPLSHVRKIVALSEIYSPEAVTRAMEDAFVFQA
ncbi:MAG: hypothetical protein JRF43_04785, partial [Deltaproteobacteria bacterium]|nr:hypothetical protein [Deltaproteobacteria bacterium]